MQEIERVKEVLRAPLEQAGYELAEASLKRTKDGLTLSLVVDREAPISLDDIIAVSNLINPLLDEADPIAEPYLLDVSSLGTEKPLRLERLDRYVGSHVALHLSDPWQGENCLTGDLLSADETKLTLAIRSKAKRKTITIERKAVDKARLAVKF